MQLVYSTAPIDRAMEIRGWGIETTALLTRILRKVLENWGDCHLDTCEKLSKLMWKTSIIIIISKWNWQPLLRATWRLPFQQLPHQGVREGATPFPGLLHFTFDPYLIMLSVKQGSIKYHFLSLWYDSTWDWTPVSLAIGKHSTH